MEQTERSGLLRAVQPLAIVGFVIVAMIGLQQLNSFVAPLFLTINLIIAAYPLATWLRRIGAPSLVGTLVVGVVVFAILLLFFWAMGWAVSALVLELPAYQEEFAGLYDQSLQLLARAGISEQWLSQQLTQLNPSNIMQLLQPALSGVGGVISLLVVTITIIFVMLMDLGSFPRRGRALSEHRPRIALSLADFTAGVRRYWVVTTVFGLIVAVIDTVFLLFLGVPLALVWGLFAFLTNYIPNVGFVIGLIPPTLMALLAGGPVDAVIVIVVYSVVNFLIQSVIQPKFNGDAVGVTATVSLLSMLLWAWVLGPLGALLGLPATLLVKALLVDHDPQLRWLNALIAADPGMADPADADEPTAAGGLPGDPPADAHAEDAEEEDEDRDAPAPAQDA